MFNLNEKYSRKTVAEIFENKIFEDNRLGKWDNSDDFTFIGRGNYASHTDDVAGFDSEKNEIKTLKVKFNYV